MEISRRASRVKIVSPTDSNATIPFHSNGNRRRPKRKREKEGGLRYVEAFAASGRSAFGPEVKLDNAKPKAQSGGAAGDPLSLASVCN